VLCFLKTFRVGGKWQRDSRSSHMENRTNGQTDNEIELDNKVRLA